MLGQSNLAKFILKNLQIQPIQKYLEYTFSGKLFLEKKICLQPLQKLICK